MENGAVVRVKNGCEVAFLSDRCAFPAPLNPVRNLRFGAQAHRAGDRFRKGKRISSLLRARVSGSVGVLLHEGFKL